MRISDWSSDVCSSDLWRLAPDMRPVARVDTCLPQRVEFEPTLDPGEAVPERRSNTLEVVCVASMQARLQATVHFTTFICRQCGFAAQPEFPLPFATGEYPIANA